jgi:DHA1 family multidrug resistance protein-like MFS transporter
VRRLLARAGRTPLLSGLPPEVGVIAAIAFCVALGFGIVAPALPIYASSFGVSAFLAGAVISVFALMRLVSSPGAGALVDRIGERRVLTTGLIIVAVSSVLAGLAQSYVQLVVLRGVGGIGSSMFTVSAMALLLKVVVAEQRGRAAGAFQAGFLLGGVAGPAVGGLVVGISIRAPFFFYAATLAAAALVSWRWLPAETPGEPVPPKEPVPDAEGADTEAETGPANPPEPTPAAPQSLGAALRNRSYQAALAANLTNGFVTFGLRSSLVPLFVIEGLNSDATLSGMGFLVAAATQAILLLPAGRMADERGRRPALLVGTLLTLIGMGALVIAGSSWLFLVAMAISGLAAAFMGSAPAAVAGDIVGPGGKGIVIAVFQMTADFGAIVGPLLAGFLADQLGYGPAFAVGAAVAALALVLAAVMPETLRARQHH